MPLDEQMHVVQVSNMPTLPIGNTTEGTASARRIMDAMSALGL